MQIDLPVVQLHLETKLWICFCFATGYMYIVDNIRSLDAVDTTYQCFYLRSLVPLFASHIDLVTVLRHLLESGVIAQIVKCDVERLRAQSGVHEAWHRLILKLPNIKTGWYCQFVKAVQTIETINKPKHALKGHSLVNVLLIPSLSCGIDCTHIQTSVSGTWTVNICILVLCLLLLI